MRKKSFCRLFLAAGVVTLAACADKEAWWNNGEYEYTPVVNDGQYNGQDMTAADAAFLADNPEAAARVYNKRIPPLNSVVVCREKQCAPASLSASREYIFNALAHIIDNNLDETALLCEANPQAHVCTNPYLTVPAKIGVTPAYVFFDGVKIVDASTAKGKTALNLALGYNLSYNGQTPTVCKPDTAMLYVKGNNDIVLNGNGFKCDMTSVGTTTIRIMFDIDYIDLDYGYIGGYYSIGLSGPATGGGSGYGLIRLPGDTHPLNPALLAKEEKKAPMEIKPAVKPEVNAEAVNQPIQTDENKAKKAEDKEVLPDSDRGEYKAVTPDKPREKLKLPEDMANGGMNKGESPKAQHFETEENRAHSNSNVMQPIRITPDTVVKSDRLILKPEEPQDIRPFEVDGGEPEFEEIYVDDLDEYIK